MKLPGRREIFAKFGLLGGAAALAASPAKAQTGSAVERRFVKNSFSQNNAYSQAVVTSGGHMVWLAGQASPQKDASGKSLAGDFDGQVHAIFDALSKTLEGVGGKLSDIVTMTAFITDDRYDRRFLEIRKEVFGDNFPASAMINIRSLAQPDLPIEIQSVAVIGRRRDTPARLSETRAGPRRQCAISTT
jgi:enamine deaminase RidA (YjgF/YER057c/UK114 family)